MGRRFCRARRGLIGWISLGCLVVAVLAIVFLVPLPYTFSTTLTSASAAGNGTSYVRTFPSGTHVTGSWSVPGYSMISFRITNGPYKDIYASFGLSGTYNFTSVGGAYYFSANGVMPANVTLTGSATETTYGYLSSTG